MRPIPHLRPTAAALLFAGALLVPAGGAVNPSGWPDGPGVGLRATTLPAGSAAADLSIEPGRQSDLFLAWSESSGTVLRVQRLTDAGLPAFGASGVVARSGGGLDFAGTRRGGDARGPYDLLPTTDGGVVVAWTENSILGRDLRVQRFGPAGETRFAAGGVVVLEGLGPDGEDAAVSADGTDGASAAAVFGEQGKGFLRFNRVRGSGALSWPVPGIPLDSASDAKQGPAVALLPGGETAVCWRRDGGAGLRFQVVESSTLRLPDGGAALGDSTDGRVSLRAAGAFLPGAMLLAHRFSGTVLVKLVDAFGTVVRDEAAGPGSLSGPPDITAVNVVVGGLPEGIEVKGVRGDGTAVRYVRELAGAWRLEEEIAPPVPALGGGAGALFGPGWFFDLGPSEGGGRVAGYRFGAPSPDTLDPALGPWLAVAPGETSFVRCAATPAYVFSAWVDGSGSSDAVVAARAGSFGGQDILDARGLLLRKATVKRPAAGTGSVTAAAPEAALPPARDPAPGKAAEPARFRLRVGSEGGTTGDLALLTWKGTKSLSWKATAAGAGGMTGTVKAGPSGRNLKVTVKGFPADAGERVLWLRVDLDGKSLAGTVLLTPSGKGGVKGTFRGM